MVENNRIGRGTGVVLASLLAACGGGDESRTPDATAQGQRAHALAVAKAIAAPNVGQWSAVIPLSLVPSAAANLPDGRVLMWSAQNRFSFTSAPGNTYTAIFDPATNTATERLVTETTHNMFCPGTSLLPDGRLLVSGGSSSAATSLYDPVSGVWSAGANFNITRGYHATTLLKDGSVLALGGSWNGGKGGKNAELWTAATGWRKLPGVPVDPMLGADPAGVYRSDNHMWLVPTGSGRVLQAGPSAAMNWIDTFGAGSTTSAGPRGDDAYSINGSLVMYDAGKLLKTGGAPAYENANATTSSQVLDVTGGGASVRRIASMAYARAFHNSVVLPNGEVMIVGGATYPVTFSDNTAVLAPELWDPVTESFMTLPAMSVARTYHSTALLLPDGRVASIGGGLCGNGCAANHANLQLYTPHYLLNDDGTPATRPVIQSAPTQGAYGTTIAVTTDSAVASFALVRLSANTHTVNNDQRRLPVAFQLTGTNQYALSLPDNPGVALPGNYMLFALDSRGVPSVATTVRLAAEAVPQLQSPSEQTVAAGSTVTLQVLASGPGVLAYQASNLPAGLQIDAGSGAISGTPSAPGRYVSTVSVSNSIGRVSTDLVWNVSPAGPIYPRYVKLEALTEVNGKPYTTMAEFNLLDRSGAVMSRAGWTIAVDSQETAGSNNPGTNAIDGAASTYWFTQWQSAAPPPPHTFVVDMGVQQDVGGFKVLPRQDNANGRIGKWNFYISVDKKQWIRVTQGTFANDPSERTVYPIAASVTNTWPVLTAPQNQTVGTGDNVSVPLVATDADGDPLSYSVSGLPPGLTVNASSGRITGSPTQAGVYPATAKISDGRGGVVTADFSWTVLARTVTIAPVSAPPIAAGNTATFTAVADAGNGPSYAWNFGDGSAATPPSTASTTNHVYAAPGVYNVTVTVTAVPSGASQTLNFLQAVYAAPPSSARGVSSSGLALQPMSNGGARLWVVNPDGDSVGVVDTSTRGKVGEVAVGAAPRSVALAPDGRMWVTSKATATISIVSTDSLTVAQTVSLPRASQPSGIVFSPDGSAAYVALEATGQLMQLDPLSGAVRGSVGVGPNPRHLAITPDGQRVLVARFVSQPLPGESTAAVQTSLNGLTKGAEVVVVTPTLTIERTVVLQVSDKADSTVQGRGLPNYLAAPAISPDGLSAWVPSKQDNVQRGSLRDGQNLDFQNTVRAVSSRINLSSLSEDYPSRIDHDNAGVASAAVYHPTGAYLFVALPTSRQVAVVDPALHTELFRLDVGRASDALAVSGDGTQLYVRNFMDRSLQVIDLSRLLGYGERNAATLATVSTQSTEKLNATVLNGKRLFYDARDPRLARDSYMSCASCHDDGGTDGRTWDFTGLGEGLRNTISLRGRAGGQGFRHWSANFDESQDFEGQIRSFAQGTGLMSDADFAVSTRSQPLGATKAGVSADLDALAAYLASLDTFAPSPLRNADGSLTASAVAGKAVFTSNCAGCHGGGGFTDSAAANLHDVGTLKPSSGMRLGATLTGIDTPTLRDVWATAPYLHDGSAASLSDAISAHNGFSLSSTDLTNVAAYVSQIGSDEPGPRVARYVRLQALSEVNGKAWSSMAEFNVLDTAGNVVSRAGWTATADSAESTRESDPPANAIDGSATTMWHTVWSTSSPPPPHTFTVNMNAINNVGGFKYLPRADSPNGRIASWRFFISSDGVSWTQVAQGTMVNSAAEKTIMFPPP